MAKTADIYKRVTTQIIELMEQHRTNWVRPWAETGHHYNASSKRYYTGVNILSLGMSSAVFKYDIPAWDTFKGWKKQDGAVRKSERATRVIFWKHGTFKKTDETTGEEARKEYWMLREYCLFNVAQIDGVNANEYAVAPLKKFAGAEPCPEADAYVANTNAMITHGGNRACYSPTSDIVKMPKPEHFNGTETYYNTLLHELAHWTGHASRLNRLKTTGFGSSAYAQEELVAEISAAFSCVKLGVSPEPRADHARYLNGWIENIKNDPRAIFRATSDAQKACDYLDSLQTEPTDARLAA